VRKALSSVLLSERRSYGRSRWQRQGLNLGRSGDFRSSETEGHLRESRHCTTASHRWSLVTIYPKPCVVRLGSTHRRAALSAVNGWVKTCSALSRRPVMRLACSAATVLVCMILLGSATLSQSDSGSQGVSANDLARRVITNELKFQDDHTNWMYRLEKEEDGKKQVQEIIETKEGSLSRLLSINDRPLPRNNRRKKTSVCRT
jgi:hypothetical protein